MKYSRFDKPSAGPIFDIGPVPFIKHWRIVSSGYPYWQPDGYQLARPSEWGYTIESSEMVTGFFHGPTRPGERFEISESSLVQEVRRFSLNPANSITIQTDTPKP